MTQNKEPPRWLVEGDAAASVKKAQESGAPESDIIGGLADAEFVDVPKRRIEAIVESIPDSGTGGDTTSLPLSQDPSIEETPREQGVRFASVGDIPYLSPREAARVIGLALEQFDGNTVRPAANESTECDLYWNRQYMTVGLRIIPVMAETVGEEHVLALSDGVTTVDNTRTPSELAVVTNGKFTNEAKTAATDNGIHCFDGGHLEAWLKRAKITPKALGTVLEEGENHDGPLDDVVDIPGVPSSISVEPFEIERAIEEATIPDGTEITNGREGTGHESKKTDEAATTGGSGVVTEETDKPSGETGTLYADPSEDGDYEAFDRFVDDIRHGDSSQETADQRGSESAATSHNEDPEEATTTQEDVPRKELLFDLIDMRTAAGEPVTKLDIRKHGSYSIAQFEAEFGSLSAALDAAGIEYDGDSL